MEARFEGERHPIMNKHITKALAVAAAGATIFSMAACGNSNDSSSAANSKLTVAWWGNQTRNDLQAKVDSSFATANNVTVDGQFSQWADYWQKMSTNAAGKQLPDVFAMDFSYLNQYIENGLLEPLDDYIAKGTLDMSDVDANTLATGKGADGKTYAIPSGVNAPVIIVNQGILDELGITIPDNWTLDDYMKISKEVYEKTGIRSAYGFMGDAYNLEYNLRAHDVKLFDGEKLGTEDTSLYAEYFNVFEKSYTEKWGVSAEFYSGITLNAVEQDPLVKFTDASNQAWNSLAWNSQLTAYAKVNPDLKLALYPWPSANVKKSNYVHPGQYWAIAKTSKNKELAAKFISYYTNDTEVAKTMLLDRGIPIASKAVDAIESSLTDVEKTIVEYQNTVPGNSSPINQPMPSKAAEINSTVMKDIEEKIMYGKLTAQQAAEEFIKQANDALK